MSCNPVRRCGLARTGTGPGRSWLGFRLRRLGLGGPFGAGQPGEFGEPPVVARRRVSTESPGSLGLSGKDEGTIAKCKFLAENHVIPPLGSRQFVKLSADDVDRWLADRAKVLSTRSLYEVRSVLRRSVTRAQARDKVKRNVVHDGVAVGQGTRRDQDQEITARSRYLSGA